MLFDKYICSFKMLRLFFVIRIIKSYTRRYCMKMLGNTNFEQNFVYEKTQKTNNNSFFPKFGDGSNLKLLFVICVVLM